VLGFDAYRDRVKIYGTDIDETALDAARAGVYTARELDSVPEALRERYFEQAEQRFGFRKDLRRTVIFGRNNLVQDAPISRLDLLVCRNTLMYLTAETQGRILRHFHFALREGGVLMLGKAEMMLSHRDLFAALDLRRRVFAKQAARPSLQARLTRLGQAEDLTTTTSSDDDRLSRDVALELGPEPQLIVSRTGAMTFANLPARAMSASDPTTPGGRSRTSTSPTGSSSCAGMWRHRCPSAAGSTSARSRTGPTSARSGGCRSRWCRCWTTAAPRWRSA
jgi:two-component system, chemotaxis family, CheB/CheR fusion protein